MRFQKCFLTVLVLALLPYLMASAFDLPQSSWVVALSLGPVWEDAGDKQTLYLAPDLEKTYTADNNTQALFDGELFLGLQRELSQSLVGQLGFAVAATSSAELSGNIWDDADPTFNNYTYNYQIQHAHLAMKGKLLIDRGYWVIPWVSASIGVGFNHAYDFNNTPVIFEALAMPDFSSNTETSFTYTLSAGLQKILNQHVQVGVAYEFADWGQSQLGKALGQTSASGLSLDHLYTNGIMFNLTYLP